MHDLILFPILEVGDISDIKEKIIKVESEQEEVKQNMIKGISKYHVFWHFNCDIEYNIVSSNLITKVIQLTQLLLVAWFVDLAIQNVCLIWIIADFTFSAFNFTLPLTHVVKNIHNAYYHQTRINYEFVASLFHGHILLLSHLCFPYCVKTNLKGIFIIAYTCKCVWSQSTKGQ